MEKPSLQRAFFLKERRLFPNKKWHVALCLILLLVVPAAMLWPGLHGAFLVDDQINLSALNMNGGVTSSGDLLAFVFGNTSGILGRPLSMLSFLINDRAFPGSVADYRYTNVLIHLLCAVILFVFSRSFLHEFGKPQAEAQTIALIAALSWSVIPLNVSTTLYVIQRMTELSALFTLIGLICYLRGRRLFDCKPVAAWVWIVTGLFGFGLLATLSKENGALIFLYALACEVTLLISRREKVNYPLLAVLVVPSIVLILYLMISWPALAQGYDFRVFNLTERLLTQSRVLWDYIGKIFIPLNPSWGLVNDDIEISRSLVSPLTTLAAVMGHGLVIVLAVVFRKKAPLFLFGVMWFYLGHLMESTVIPLELYYEHRNYLPSMGLLTAFVAGVLSLSKYRRIAWGGLGLFIAVSAVVTHHEARIWGDPAYQVVNTAKRHPESVRAHTDLVGLLLARNQYDDAQGLLEGMTQKWPAYLHVDLIILKYQCLGTFQGRPDITRIVEKRPIAVYSGNLPTAVDSVMEVYRNRSCEALSPNAMVKLLGSLNNLPRSRPKFDATVSYYQSQIYRDLGDLSNAMLALEGAKQKDGDSIYWLAGAMYLSSAGLAAEAKEHLNIAIKIEKMDKPFYMRKNLALYDAAKKKIEKINQ